MKILTDKKYNELMSMVEQAKIRTSLESVTRLEDDIDAPIKRCVMMWALLGWEPVYSCCGFDYVGQPYHKCHQYDEPYIFFRRNDYNKNLAVGSHAMGWTIKHIKDDYYCILHGAFRNPHWRNKDCIHVSEESVIAIQVLEDGLTALSHNFLDEITIYDSNHKNKNSLRWWQYTPKTEWLIRKSDLNLSEPVEAKDANNNQVSD